LESFVSVWGPQTLVRVPSLVHRVWRPCESPSPKDDGHGRHVGLFGVCARSLLPMQASHYSNLV